MLSNHNQQNSSFRIIEPRRYLPDSPVLSHQHHHNSQHHIQNNNQQQQSSLFSNGSSSNITNQNQSSNFLISAHNLNSTPSSNFADLPYQNRSFSQNNSVNHNNNNSSGYVQSNQSSSSNQHHAFSSYGPHGSHHQQHQPRLRNLSDTDSSYVPGKQKSILNYVIFC
jgi:hypothetical protein